MSEHPEPLDPDEAPGGERLGVLVADDDPLARAAIAATLETEAPASWSLLEADDGPEAVRIGLQLRPAIALLDLHMPRLGGDAVAQTLRQLRPSTRIALHSADRQALHERGGGLGVALFDKLELDRMAGWAHAQLRACGAIQRQQAGHRVIPLVRKVELGCGLCGYGIVTRTPPERCPMCGAFAPWIPGSRIERLRRHATPRR